MQDNATPTDREAFAKMSDDALAVFFLSYGTPEGRMAWHEYRRQKWIAERDYESALELLPFGGIALISAHTRYKASVAAARTQMLDTVFGVQS